MTQKQEEYFDAGGLSFETRTTSRTLQVQHSDEKKIELADRMASLRGEIDRIESAKKRIAGLQEEISGLAIAYRRGYETEDIDCTVYYDCPITGRKTIVRNDTGEIVEEKDMSPDELQGNLPFAPGDVEDGVTTEISDGDGNVYTIPENPHAADAEMEDGYEMAAAEREEVED